MKLFLSLYRQHLSVFRVESTHSAWTLRSIRWYSLIFAGNLQSAAAFDGYALHSADSFR